MTAKRICILMIMTAATVCHAEGMRYGQAPQLAEMVKKGLLPPIEERLPPEPVVVPVYEEIGRYGGKWRRLMRGTSDIHAFNRVNYEMILRFAPDPLDGVMPNIAERWEFNDDLSELTLYIRKGLRWSDGAPFSADDVVFCWDKLMCDTRITPSVPSYWRPGGKRMEMTQVDKYTVRLKFGQPYPMALDYLAFRAPQWPLGQERYGMYAPKHYLAEPLERTKLVDGVQVPDPDYETLEKLAYDFNTERPVLTPWKISEWNAGTRLLADRNPYYWKVDPAGNQLPYIDEVEHEIYYNTELLNFRAVTGELDMQLRGFRTEEMPLLMGFQKKGDYRVIAYHNSGSGTSGIALNFEYRNDSDPEQAATLRKYFQMKEFRQALCLATDRDMIRDVAFKGQTTQPSFDFPEESGLNVGDPDVDRWLVYDPARANRMLDAIGLERRDGNGFRVMRAESGRIIPLSIIVEVAGDPSTIAPLEMVCAQWAMVGVRVTIMPQDRTLNDLRLYRGGLHMAAHSTDNGSYPILQGSLKFAFAAGSWCHSYQQWYNTRKQPEPAGVEPPDYIKRLQEIYDQMIATDDHQVRRQLAEEVVRVNAEEVFFIPTQGAWFYLGVVKNNMRNVPEKASGSWIVSTPGNLNCATFFFREEN